MLGRPARHQHLARRRRLGLLLGGASRRSAAVRGQRGDRRGGLLCPRVLYVRRSELKEISPDAVDVSSFDEAGRVGCRGRAANRRSRTAAARSRCLRRRSGRDDFGGRKGTFTISRRTHPSRLDVFGKTEAAGQRGVVEEGDLLDPVAAEGEHHHAPGLRVQVIAEGRLAVGAGRA
jgi:hypothetical protein